MTPCSRPRITRAGGVPGAAGPPRTAGSPGATGYCRARRRSAWSGLRPSRDSRPEPGRGARGPGNGTGQGRARPRAAAAAGVDQQQRGQFMPERAAVRELQAALRPGSGLGPRAARPHGGLVRLRGQRAQGVLPGLVGLPHVVQVAGDDGGLPGGAGHRRVKHRDQRRRLVPHLPTVLIQRLPRPRRAFPRKPRRPAARSSSAGVRSAGDVLSRRIARRPAGPRTAARPRHRKRAPRCRPPRGATPPARRPASATALSGTGTRYSAPGARTSGSGAPSSPGVHVARATPACSSRPASVTSGDDVEPGGSGLRRRVEQAEKVNVVILPERLPARSRPCSS